MEDVTAWDGVPHPHTLASHPIIVHVGWATVEDVTAWDGVPHPNTLEALQETLDVTDREF